MALIIQKFGGDALGDKGKGSQADLNDLSGASLFVEKFRHVAEIVRNTQRAGHQVVVVVSAMGDTTNRLLRMANALNKRPPERELDMLMTTGEQQAIALLAIALEAMGLSAISFTGPQVGIVTDSFFGRSRIVEIKAERLKEALAQGKVPIVAGFQGASENQELTTLGRGGSDITAVALGAALGANVCEFYKDVDGIFTTDPRVCPRARKINRISYEEMLELASLGAGILHSRSVEFAKNYKIPLHVRSFLHDEPGTFVTEEESSMENVVVSGVAFNRDEAKISVMGVPDKPGVAADLFGRLGEAGIVVDVISQAQATGVTNDISFTVGKADYNRATQVAQKLAEEIGAKSVVFDDSICKVSVVGVGMRSHANVAGKMFGVLSKAGINIQLISTSEIKISVIIAEADLERAVNAIHDAFDSNGAFGKVEE
ncbi:MAG: aspartate kinase [Candidatus Sumerlaeia bacterium]|nr:aspartate kinase [Candidatus Sumerlaeia bacterium]